MYVMIVHGLASKALREAGQKSISRAFPVIPGSFIRKPITDTIVIRTNTAIFI